MISPSRDTLVALQARGRFATGPMNDSCAYLLNTISLLIAEVAIQVFDDASVSHFTYIVCFLLVFGAAEYEWRRQFFLAIAALPASPNRSHMFSTISFLKGRYACAILFGGFKAHRIKVLGRM